MERREGREKSVRKIEKMKVCKKNWEREKQKKTESILYI